MRVWLWLCLFLLTSAGLTAGERHPMDGPDAELRVMHGSNAVTLAVRVNLAWLDEHFDVPREVPDTVAAEERAALEEELTAWLQEHQVLTGEGLPAAASGIVGTWSEADPERVPYFPRAGARALTFLDLRLTWSVPAGLDALQLAWPSFPIDPVLAGPGSSPRTKVKAVLLTGAEERVVELTEDAPEYRWRLPQQSGSDHLLPLPAAPVAGSGILRTRAMIALGAITALFVFIARRLPKRGALAGLALLPLAWFGVLRMPRATVVPPETQLEVFGVLHANLYRAFDFHEAEAVYDALEASTQGELLRRLYGEIHDSLVLEEEDGLLCRVEAVTPFDTVLEAPSADSPPGTFGVLAHWRVDGVLHHWGHSHHRRQELRAHFDVAPLAEGWRLVGSRILESKRVPVAEPAPANPTPAAGNLPEDEVW